MEIYVLNIFGDDIHNVFAFDNYNKVIDEISKAMTDQFAFDVDSPYNSKEELNNAIADMEFAIYDDGEYESGELKFTVDKCLVN